ncbi:hypothetical protein C6W22_10165 [Bacillus atrophaeus]|nr:hypothetical protein C6W22_10165 [Bacillus atrophaeus]QUF67434.1 hypothetical protein KCX77_17575 [Bacillus atrophaeus]
MAATRQKKWWQFWKG